MYICILMKDLCVNISSKRARSEFVNMLLASKHNILHN